MQAPELPFSCDGDNGIRRRPDALRRMTRSR